MQRSYSFGSVPASAFCARSGFDATKALESLEKRLRQEFEESRIANRKAFEESRVANRKAFEESRIANRKAFEESRRENKDRIKLLEKSRDENTKRIKILERSAKRNKRQINTLVTLSMLRQKIRMVELFFNELYKAWFESYFKKTRKNGNLYGSNWSHNTQLRNDYHKYPHPGEVYATREARLKAYQSDEGAITEAEYRRRRAAEFLNTFWSGFGGNFSINIGDWNRTVKFVELTNNTCHSSQPISSASSGKNAINMQRRYIPRVHLEGFTSLMTKLNKMIHAVGDGRKNWTSKDAVNFVIEHKKLFPGAPNNVFSRM
jgi:hypothetical protein